MTTTITTWQTLSPQAMGIMLDLAAGEFYATADGPGGPTSQELRDELHAQALIEYTATKKIVPAKRLLDLDHLATLVRRDSLSSQELRDVAASIDANEPEYVGPGEYVWEAVRTRTVALGVSAEFLVDETLHYLGWD